ncbi:hypothetical protein PAQ31011_04845 [Pandoraea aquatica]|uniref:Uncharacterized protein n=1 Tax=Pandoraea aquatica TaxID=2508290 RepID=A0A5E4YXD1_9BURK|nr:hypothetical protein [Pandoraea aquatica]VVE53118.1 hypothetical protein PAQ31011_04845 [Pandoraea aquatica]
MNTCEQPFSIEFSQWLRRALERGVPMSVRAFAFNLFELTNIDNAKFGVEIVGAGKFDQTDSDWACNEVWEPIDRVLRIPIIFSGDAWDDCLLAIRSLLRTLLEIDDDMTRVLKSREGVGIGFVDGDLHIVWCR